MLPNQLSCDGLWAECICQIQPADRMASDSSAAQLEKSDLICSDRWTRNCTSARVTLHSTTATPETAGASLKPQSNRKHLMRAGVYLCFLNFKGRRSLHTHTHTPFTLRMSWFLSGSPETSQRCLRNKLKEYSPGGMHRCSCSSC